MTRWFQLNRTKRAIRKLSKDKMLSPFLSCFVLYF